MRRHDRLSHRQNRFDGDSITPASGYPHTRGFVVFAQLHGGLGKVPFHIDIRQGSITGPLVYASNVHHLLFPYKNFVTQLAYTVPACKFPQADEYLVESFVTANGSPTYDCNCNRHGELTMAPETENKPNPLHDPETSFNGETVFITENPPGGLPLDSAEVIEREKKRREELAKRLDGDNQATKME